MSSVEEEQRNVTLQFSGRDYDIEVSIEHDQLLVVHVEDCQSLDHWVGKYDTSYIEELSHKTGNFKQFSIFCSMLESALTQSSDTVSLDLLTFDDLNALRELKNGQTAKPRKQKVNTNQKRYLIMTYTVEFDQIHYPLPLTYSGKNNTVSHKRKAKDLNYLKSNTTCNDVEDLMEENRALKSELKECYLKLKEVDVESVSKEIKVLKKVVLNLENDLTKERTKHQRLLTKKKKEYDELLEEFEDLKASERNFRVRCKNLTEELAMIKRNSRLSPAINGRPSRLHSTMKQNNTRLHTTKSSVRSTSRDRVNSTNRTRARSSSNDRSVRRTPSPGFIRFDPSAYVKNKEAKRRESERSLSRRRTPTSTSKRTRSTPSYLSKPPTSNTKSKTRGSSSIHRGRNNRRSSGGSDTDNSVTLLKGGSNKKKAAHRMLKGIQRDSEDEELRSKKPPSRPRGRSPKVDLRKVSRDQDDEEHSIGIAEIDARLEALQRFMKDNMD